MIRLNTAARTHERALIGSTTAEPGRRGKRGTTTGIPGKGQRRKRSPLLSPAVTLPRWGAPASGPLNIYRAGPAPPGPPREETKEGKTKEGERHLLPAGGEAHPPLPTPCPRGGGAASRPCSPAGPGLGPRPPAGPRLTLPPPPHPDTPQRRERSRLRPLPPPPPPPRGGGGGGTRTASPPTPPPPQSGQGSLDRPSTDLVESGEPVHIGVVDVGTPLQQSQHLLGVSAGAGGQEDGAVVELHLGLLAFDHGRLQVGLGADPALELLVPLLLGVRHLHTPLAPAPSTTAAPSVHFIPPLSHSAPRPRALTRPGRARGGRGADRRGGAVAAALA